MIEPLVPAEVDLRDFPGTMIQRARLFGSTFHARVSDGEWRAGVTLWLKTWDRVPAGSLPADEVDQCRLAELGRDLKSWRKISAGALHGWVIATDGLMYHRVVAEVVIEAWLEKLGQQLSGGAGNAKRWGLVFDPTPIQTQLSIATAMLFTLNPQSRSLRKRRHPGIPTGHPTVGENNPDGTPNSNPVPIAREVKGREVKGNKEKNATHPLDASLENAKSNPLAEGVKKRPRTAENKNGANGHEPGRTVATARAYAEAYEARYHVAPTFNKTVNGQLASFVDRIGIDESPYVASHFVHSNRGLYVSAMHSTNLLLRDAEALRTEWATNRHGTETEARSSDRTAANGNVFGKLIEEERNAKRRPD